MLAKKYRLPFKVRFGKALFFPSHFFNARIKQNGLLHNRYAILVSKKIDKRATVRNRIRRLIYAVLFEFLGKTKQGFDFLFSANKEAVGKTKKDFYLAIESMLEKEDLLN